MPRVGGGVARLQDGPRKGGAWRLVLDDGTVHEAGVVVLATGNPPPGIPFKLDPEAAPLLEKALWQGDWQHRLAGTEEIAIIGGGLTAMDALMVLHEEGHQGPVRVVSPFHPGGRPLPPRQANWREAWDIDAKPAATAAKLLDVFVETLPGKGWESAEWQCAFEGLREWLPPCWQALPRAERLRAMRRLSRLWQQARYRASPQAADAADALERQGRLALTPGRVAAMAADQQQGRTRARLDLASGGSVSADRVLLATGAGMDPLATAMKDQGLVHPDMRGLEVDRDFRVLDANWRGWPRLFALGPPTAFTRGDVVGATTIAKEASALADRMAGGRL